MSRRETRHQTRRAASKEALKQMQLMTAYDDEDSTETYEITSDEDVIAVEMPPKKKYRLSHRKSSDGNDRDVLVLKTITYGEETLKLEAFVEDLSPVQRALHEKLDAEVKQMNAQIEKLMKQTGAQIVYQGDVCSVLQVGDPPSLTYTGVQPQSNLVLQGQKSNNYQLVMDPRLGLIVGTVTPTTTAALPAQTVTPPQQTITNVPARQTRKRGRPSTQAAASPQVVPQKQAKQTKSVTQPTPVVTLRPTESTAVGGLSTGATTPTTRGASTSVVDLTSDDGRPAADSREISFNKLQGKTFPSLVVVARPHLRVKDAAGGDRGRLDSKVKAVLMHVPTKFTEWLIQQGLVRSEQTCCIHDNSKLKLGMYSDVSKFPYSGGYVWISECCPQRFVSVFSGSLFEGSPHPPSVILKLIYHWACQTNVQNVVQWVKVDNLYVKGLNTWLRAACTVALHTHIAPLGGPGCKVEVGVISLGTTSQDGHQRQVKVEVLGLLETENKLVRLRAVEPLADGDRNYKKRFSKILEPIVQWVHPDSIIVTDLTVDKGTLHLMGFKHVQQTTSSDHGNSNRTIMEYLRRIVPRMFQNTLSLLSRQIIQQFLDELVWREWFGTTAAHAFDNMVIHLSQQTRCETGQSLIMRLNKVAANPFKNWSIASYWGTDVPAIKPANPQVQTPKRYGGNRKPRVTAVKASSPVPEVTKPPKSTSPDIPEQMVPLENYYYGTISASEDYKSSKITLNLKCCMCRSQFTNNIKLMIHLFSHAHSVTAGAQQCRYCLASVTTADGLAKHISSSHPFETRFADGYACVICETRFQNPYSLGKHMSRDHNPAELPYLCGTCGYRCSSHKQAVDHFYNSHDGGGTIQCPFCLKSTNVCVNGRMVPQNLNFFLQHLQKHQKKAVAKKCGQCALWFIQKESLKEHQNKMHESQRHKPGFIPWSVPRNGTIMVPKSKQDHQPVEEEDIDYATIKIDAPSHLLCKECKLPLTNARHFPSHEDCSNNNCQYSTCCAASLKAHIAICKDLNASLPIQDLPYEMFCVCGYSDTDGNTLAKHLALCERKSAYPSAEKAQAACVTHSMLDVLGLVRRSEEPIEKIKLKKVEDLKPTKKAVEEGRNVVKKEKVAEKEENEESKTSDTTDKTDSTNEPKSDEKSSSEGVEVMETDPTNEDKPVEQRTEESKPSDAEAMDVDDESAAVAEKPEEGNKEGDDAEKGTTEEKQIEEIATVDSPAVEEKDKDDANAVSEDTTEETNNQEDTVVSEKPEDEKSSTCEDNIDEIIENEANKQLMEPVEAKETDENVAPPTEKTDKTEEPTVEESNENQKEPENDIFNEDLTEMLADVGSSDVVNDQESLQDLEGTVNKFAVEDIAMDNITQENGILND